MSVRDVIQAAAGGTQADVYQIENSLLFNSADSAYLSRTPASAGNRKTWTWSGWVKRSALGNATIFQQRNDSDNSQQFQITFKSTDEIRIIDQSSGTNQGLYDTVAVYRDLSAWYHIVVACDTTDATAGDRVKLYVNGERVVSFSSPDDWPLNYDTSVNSTVRALIGVQRPNTSATLNNYFNGYLAEVHFVDGQALTPSNFGETSPTTGEWRPIAYTGTYGNNGFFLKFEGSPDGISADSSGNGNDWTPYNFYYGDFPYSYANTTLTGTNGMVTPQNLFDGSINTVAQPNSTSTDNYILFTPTTPIPYTSSVRIYTYAANGYGITNTFELNGGTPVSFVGGGSNFNGSAWIDVVASGSGTISSLKVRLQRNVAGSRVSWAAIEIDGVILTFSDYSSSFVDTPTNYGDDTGAGGEVRGNYATLNPLAIYDGTFSRGNLAYTGPSGWRAIPATIHLPSTGKWYAEASLLNGPANNTFGSLYNGFGLIEPSQLSGWNYNSATSFYVTDTGHYSNYSSGSSGSFTQPVANTVLGFAVDRDANTVTVYRDGSAVLSNISIPSGDLTFFRAAYNSTKGDLLHNFGQRPWNYAPPSGFKALCTQNLSDPAIKDGRDHFNTVLYTGNGSSQNVTGVGFEPDLVWIKRYDASGQDHVWQDAVRGFGSATKLASSSTAGENNTGGGVTDPQWGYVTGTITDGFSITASTNGDQVNKLNYKYAAWNWNAGGSSATNTDGTITSTVRANPAAGFSIVTYTGNGTNGSTIGHGLGVPPKFIITKKTNSTDTSNWATNGPHRANPWDGAFTLNTTNTYTAASSVWNDTAPTSTVFTVGVADAVNVNTKSYVAYCFAEVEGFSKILNWTGIGGSDGVFLNLGFRPAFVLIKRLSTESWVLVDTARNPYNVTDKYILADTTGGNGTTTLYDFVSNGLKMRGPSQNELNNEYIAIAFAESPFKYSLAR